MSIFIYVVTSDESYRRPVIFIGDDGNPSRSGSVIVIPARGRD